MALRSARQLHLRQRIHVPHEIWVRFGQEQEPTEKKYLWVKPGQAIAGFFEDLVYVGDAQRGYWLLKLILKDVRLLVFVNNGVVRQIEAMKQVAAPRNNSHVGIFLRLKYHGLAKAKRPDGTVIRYHDIELEFDDEKYDERLVSPQVQAPIVIDLEPVEPLALPANKEQEEQEPQFEIIDLETLKNTYTNDDIPF